MKPIISAAIAVLSITILSASPALAATIHVPAFQPTIQAGINYASAGDLVFVEPGTYAENIDFLGKAITVRGAYGAYVTAIDGSQSGSVATFENGETATSVLEGFTLTNGSGTYNCGGGIYCDSSSPTIKSCAISGNAVSDYGGGIHCISSSPTITGCRISGNTADYYGGGVYSDSSSPTITNCTVSGNTAVLGGGVFCDSSSSPTITNCTLTGNSASTAGGGIYSTSTSSPAITNCILWGDYAAANPEIYVSSPKAPTVTYSDVQGGWTGTGNINSDPLFEDPGSWDDAGTPADPSDDFWVEGDYHLTAGSPCIDAGTTVSIATDIDGDARPQGAAYDMGADEFISSHHITFIRHRTINNQYLNIYDAPTTVGGDINPLIASDTWIGNIGANSEITHMSAGDIDGDGTEELVFIRLRTSGNQYLNIYDAPAAVGGDINPLIASDTWIGNIGANSEITHMSGGDIDGDGTDELIFIRHRTNGNQYLNIYDIPTTVGSDINPLLASDTWIGNVGTNNEITHMVAGDSDGDGTDELTFIRHRTNNNQYLNIYAIPTTVGGDINPLLASDTWIGNVGTNNEITHMVAGDSDGDGTDELTFIRHRTNNNQYLNIYAIPTTVGSDINPLIASDTWIGNAGTSSEITHMATIR